MPVRRWSQDALGKKSAKPQSSPIYTTVKYLRRSYTIFLHTLFICKQDFSMYPRLASNLQTILLLQPPQSWESNIYAILGMPAFITSRSLGIYQTYIPTQSTFKVGSSHILPRERQEKNVYTFGLDATAFFFLKVFSEFGQFQRHGTPETGRATDTLENTSQNPICQAESSMTKAHTHQRPLLCAGGRSSW